MAARALITLLVLEMCGCLGGSLSVISLHPPPHALAQRRPEDVDVFTVRPPDWPFVEMAIINTTDGLVEARRAAGEMGCDGIFVLAPLHDRLLTHTRVTCLVLAN
jgi:hypothetical protein